MYTHICVYRMTAITRNAVGADLLCATPRNVANANLGRSVQKKDKLRREKNDRKIYIYLCLCVCIQG